MSLVTWLPGEPAVGTDVGAQIRPCVGWPAKGLRAISVRSACGGVASVRSWIESCTSSIIHSLSWRHGSALQCAGMLSATILISRKSHGSAKQGDNNHRCCYSCLMPPNKLAEPVGDRIRHGGDRHAQQMATYVFVFRKLFDCFGAALGLLRWSFEGEIVASAPRQQSSNCVSVTRPRVGPPIPPNPEKER
jgi:hypothetical protein